MRFQAFYSSSKHNLYIITADNGKRLIIDPGCTPKQLQKALNYDLTNIIGCLLTHEHRDHSRSIEFVLDSGIDVYSGYGTFDSLGIEPIATRHIHVIYDRDRFSIGGTFNILPFAVEHDCIDPYGFIIKTDDDHLLFVTDTSHIKQRFGLAFDIIAICCNYEKDTLQARVNSGDINETFAKRLLTSHMEKEVTKSYIRDFCNLSKCTEIYLLHMSANNADKEKIRKEFENEFFVKTITP